MTPVRRGGQLAAGLQAAGAHAVAWDGRDDLGRAVASGACYLRLSAGAWTGVRPLALVR